MAFFDTSLNSYASNSDSELPLSEWFHLVCTREITIAGSTFVTQSFYVDSVYDGGGTFNFADPIYSGSQTFYIGGDASTNPWNGEMIYLRLYNKCLTSNEVKQLYLSSLGLWQKDWFVY